MKDILYLIIDLFTKFSTFFRKLAIFMKLDINDKQLHFIVIGFLCLFIFIIVQFVFKRLAKWSITSISFIYTLTIGIMIAFAIEIGQWKSGSGHMDFADIVYGIYGFIAFFVVYQMVLYVQRKIKKYFIERKVIKRD